MYIPENTYQCGFRDGGLYIWTNRGDKIVFVFIGPDQNNAVVEKELSPLYVECTEEEAKCHHNSVFLYKDQFLNPTPSWWRIENAPSEEGSVPPAAQ